MTMPRKFSHGCVTRWNSSEMNRASYCWLLHQPRPFVSQYTGRRPALRIAMGSIQKHVGVVAQDMYVESEHGFSGYEVALYNQRFLIGRDSSLPQARRRAPGPGGGGDMQKGLPIPAETSAAGQMRPGIDISPIREYRLEPPLSSSYRDTSLTWSK